MKETIRVSNRPCNSCGRQKSKQNLFMLSNFCGQNPIGVGSTSCHTIVT